MYQVLTFVSLQLVFGHTVRAAVEVFLQRVYLPTQDVSERLHLCQLLPQAVALLKETGIINERRVEGFLFIFLLPLCTCDKNEKLVSACANIHTKPVPMSSVEKVNIKQESYLEGGCGGGGVAAGSRCERQHGAVSPQTGL